MFAGGNLVLVFCNTPSCVHVVTLSLLHVPETCLCCFFPCVYVLWFCPCYTSPPQVPTICPFVCMECEFVTATCPWDISLLHFLKCVHVLILSLLHVSVTRACNMLLHVHRTWFYCCYMSLGHVPASCPFMCDHLKGQFGQILSVHVPVGQHLQ